MLARIRSRCINAAIEGLGAIYGARLGRYPALSDLLVQMRQARSSGVSDADAIALYEAVTERKPRTILEFGAGQSSAVIALAARGAKFVAIEESQGWLAHHRETIPKELLSTIELIQRSVDVRDVSGTRAAHYTGVPCLPYEFIHVDGPFNRNVGAKLSCDVIDLLPILAPSCMIVFDGRESSARLAKPHLENAGFRSSRHPFTLSHQFIR